MTKLIAISTYCAALIVALTTTTTFASIVGVSGGILSSAGTAPAIIAAPPKVENSDAFNTGQQGFDEMQNVLLLADLLVDGGFIAKDTRVSSQMIFLNKEDGISGLLTHLEVEWTFDGEVLGVMSDRGGLLEGASSGILGALITTTYPDISLATPFPARGMEQPGADGYSVSGNTVTVSMNVTQPGDWIRVVTAAAVPEPTTFLVWGVLGLCATAGTRRRQ